jgi:predicted transcriptional regulator
MKRAVVLSNATTKVQIGDTEYTVAEAIDAKNHSMELKQTLLNMMVYQYNKAQNELTRHTGEALEKDAERHVKEVLAASIKEGNAASVANLAQVIREEYLKNNTWDMIDPLGVAQEIEAINDEISKFNADVDAALSTSNAVTIVEFSY